jgi:hypothetical protein
MQLFKDAINNPEQKNAITFFIQNKLFFIYSFGFSKPPRFLNIGIWTPIYFTNLIKKLSLSAIMPVRINSSNDESVKEFFAEVSSVKLVTKLFQVVLHHPFADHKASLQVFL